MMKSTQSGLDVKVDDLFQVLENVVVGEVLSPNYDPDEVHTVEPLHLLASISTSLKKIANSKVVVETEGDIAIVEPVNTPSETYVRDEEDLENEQSIFDALSVGLDGFEDIPIADNYDSDASLIQVDIRGRRYIMKIDRVDNE